MEHRSPRLTTIREDLLRQEEEQEKRTTRRRRGLDVSSTAVDLKCRMVCVQILYVVVQGVQETNKERRSTSTVWCVAERVCVSLQALDQSS